MTSCSVCDFKKQCGVGSAALLASEPILQERLRNTLADVGLEFRQNDELFVFPNMDLSRLAIALDSHLSEPEKDDLRIGTASVAGLSRAVRFREFGERLSTTWFDEALEEDKFTFHFQPIVDVGHSRIFAHECLVRLFGDRLYGGGEIIDAAISRGRVHAFDSYCRQKAIRESATGVGLDSLLFVNFLPSSIYNPEFCLQSTLEAVRSVGRQSESVVFEVVESEQIRSVTHLKRIRDFYRANGFGFALDDLGSGSNSLQMMADFEPDYIKLDKSLTSGLNKPIRLALIRKIVELAAEFQIQVIAEGVETPEQAALLFEAGIRLMQGWLFGKPAASGIRSITSFL